MELTIPLYHYTSQKGLLGILNNGKLRMTSILYLNDSSEYSHCFDLFLKDLNFDCRLESFLKQIKTSPDEYIFSLSEKRDDLSQWRGYCPPTGGYCIEFDPQKLLSIVKKGGYKLEKVLYRQDEKENKIKSISKGLSVSPNSESIEKEKLLIRMSRIAPYLKDEAFEKEEEWRIICDTFGACDICHREGTSMIIPYIERPFIDDNQLLPLRKIIIGPTPHKVLSKKSVESLIHSSSYAKSVEVECSPIPYRSW
ncbi:MAG: DUF2971 domain-containing protein [Syntrophus sp. (in: bacteria)]